MIFSVSCSVVLFLIHEFCHLSVGVFTFSFSFCTNSFNSKNNSSFSVGLAQLKIFPPGFCFPSELVLPADFVFKHLQNCHFCDFFFFFCYFFQV